MEEYNHGWRILYFPQLWFSLTSTAGSALGPSPTINVPFIHVTKPTITNFLTNKLIRALLCIVHSLL